MKLRVLPYTPFVLAGLAVVSCAKSDSVSTRPSLIGEDIISNQPGPGNSSYLTGFSCCSDYRDIDRCYINCINTMSDVNIDGNLSSRQLIERVPYNASAPYYIEIKQQSLSKGICDFFKTARQQVINTGSLFNAAPGSVDGNMHSPIPSLLSQRPPV